MLVDSTLSPEKTLSDIRKTKLLHLRDRLEEASRRLERHPWVMITGLAIVYWLAVQYTGNLILWHDEIFTYYIARSSSVQQFFTFIRLLDLNPPLGYLMTRACQDLFGDSPFVTRLPEIISFFVASIAFLYFLAKRTGILWGTFAVLLIWYSPFFEYATQARPYAILMMFFSITLLSWDAAIGGRQHRKWALAGIVLGNVGMMESHVFAIFSIGPFILAEMVRWYRTRKADWPLWACLLLPLSLVASYIPLMNRFQAEMFPYQFQGGIKKVAVFFVKWVFFGICPGLLAAVLTALATAPSQRKTDFRNSMFSSAHVALLGGFLLAPLLINLMLMRTHGAFWERYCITSAVAVYVATALYLAYQLGVSRLSAVVSALILVFITMMDSVVLPAMDKSARMRVLPKINFETYRPELPFVAASGLTFLEMDRNESANFDKRLYYMTDRASAIKYAHATIFEGLAVEKNYFPIRGAVLPYQKFISEHHHFLVFGSMFYAEDWLMKRLHDDGAQMTYLGDYYTPYKDASMYDVVMPQGK